MHTIRKNADTYEVIFVSAAVVTDVVYRATSKVDAMSVASYLNGGSYPPLWNPPLSK